MTDALNSVSHISGDVRQVQRRMRGLRHPESRGCGKPRLPGDTAIGHVRYSTAGGSMLCNAQPIVALTNKGPVALAHNGNLVNGPELRKQLENEGAIFNSM